MCRSGRERAVAVSLLPGGDKVIKRGYLLLLLVGLMACCLSCGPRSAALRATPMAAGSASGTPTWTKRAPTATRREPTATPTPMPSWTPSPLPTSTPSPSPSLTPLPTPQSSALAFAGVGQGGAMNVMLYDVLQGRRETLTHFTEPANLVDITWSHDGQWIVFVSTHDFIHGCGNERNVFRMRSDGSQLEMLTGQYVDPADVPAPYGLLRGRVVDGQGECLVCAQGAHVAEVKDDGAFQLPGVPLSATWARAVCRDGEDIRQGEVDLTAEEGEFLPVTIPVQPEGQGWYQVSLSRDGGTLAGVFYQWTLDDDGGREYAYQGMLYDIGDGRQRRLELPEERILRGVDWCPVSDRLVGALSDEEGTALWLWDAERKALAPLVEVPNPEGEIVVATDPVWSPDGSRIAFALRHRYWWEEDKYRTDIMVVTADGEQLTPLVESAWGDVASHPSWSADGEEIVYQLSTGEPDVPHGERETGDIWSVQVLSPTPVPLTKDGQSYLPALRPLPSR
ncbi:MAG: hypothetical protein U9R48_09290 [Chloroflexota bacterium]|nr:hypothetical protein [Chloroflexota bacterium]